MLNSRLMTGVRVGLITAAATSGALVGFGLRHDTAFQPFEVTGRSLLAAQLGVLALPGVAVVAGVVVHAAWMILWSLAFVTLARAWPGRSHLATAAVVAGGLGAVFLLLYAPVMGAAAAANMTMGQGVFLLAVFALSAVGGLRLVDSRHEPA